ncbi:MAG: hypothetical protein JWQ34_1376 [Mucilaginibacter sp.]|nr:hypothetical protein [Mucilaginibacter sp.]
MGVNPGQIHYKSLYLRRLVKINQNFNAFALIAIVQPPNFNQPYIYKPAFPARHQR